VLPAVSGAGPCHDHVGQVLMVPVTCVPARMHLVSALLLLVVLVLLLLVLVLLLLMEVLALVLLTGVCADGDGRAVRYWWCCCC